MAGSALPLSILTAGEVRDLERAWASAGHDLYALIERAGAAVADRAAGLAGGRAILVLAGPGGNGGDGWVAARRLAEGGARVRVASLSPPWALAGNTARAASSWRGPVADASVALESGELVVDALFGFGLRQAPEGPAASLIEQVNAAGPEVLAVDLPSGAMADDGRVPGVAIRAHETLTFHAPKPGLWLWPGRALAGRVETAALGLPLQATGLWANTPALWAGTWPRLAGDAHKYARGGVIVWSGPPLSTGASRLAARAALRHGAGAVAIAGPVEALRVHELHETAIMLRPVAAGGLAELLADRRWRAAVVGPGAGPEAGEAALAALQSPAAVVLDADALTAFAQAPDRLFDACRSRTSPTILTPHEGEYARLFGPAGGSKVERARKAAQRSGAIVVLKGPDTVVAEPGGEAVINAHAPPWLATAGSGDVLAGMIAALLARGMAGLEAAAAAVWHHGELGYRLGEGLTADDLAAARPAPAPWSPAPGP